jgi:DNA repair exonuclease SbcCD ATPase subunit
MIQSYWETKYKSHPGAESLEREEKAIKEKKEQEKKAASAKKKASDEASYMQAMKDWEQTEKDIQQKRKKALDDALIDEKQQCKKRITEKLENEQKKQNKLLTAHKKEYADVEAALAGLRFYQLIKKFQHQKSLEEITKKIHAAQYALQAAEREYAQEMQNIDQTLSRKKASLQESVIARFPMPRKPRKTAAMLYGNPTPYQLAAEAMKEEILKTLVQYGPLSYTGLIEKCPTLADLTTSRVNSYAKALEQEGEIKITQKKIDYTIYHICELAY